MTPRDLYDLVCDVLTEHRESYDRDCGEHNGCSCDAPAPAHPDDDEHGTGSRSYYLRAEWFTEHVADHVLAAIDNATPTVGP